VTDAERLQHALDLAYGHLGRRDRTVAEVRAHLAARGVEPAVVDDVVTELETQGYLDDVRYARRFAADRRTIDAWGAQRIERRLLEAGVAREPIAAALAERDTPEELEAAVAVLRRRFTRTVGDRDRERALGMLVRKGYELEIAYDAVRAFERETAA
jgi:regulatory protein